MHVAENDSIINASTIIINRQSYVNTLLNEPTVYARVTINIMADGELSHQIRNSIHMGDVDSSL